MFPGERGITASRGGSWSWALICPLTATFRKACILRGSLLSSALPAGIRQGARFSPGPQPCSPLRVVVAFPHTSTPGCRLAPGAMPTLWEGGMGGHVTAPASCQGLRGFWEAPSGQLPTLLSSKN